MRRCSPTLRTAKSFASGVSTAKTFSWMNRRGKAAHRAVRSGSKAGTGRSDSACCTSLNSMKAVCCSGKTCGSISPRSSGNCRRASVPARRAHGRPNQRHRTRRELLSAAARLLKQGATPSIEEVAQAAMVSRATAYRYFPTLDALLVEAPLEGDTPDPEALFARDGTKNPEERIDAAEAALHDMVYRNEAQLRRLLSNSLTRAPGGRHAIPVRQNRRSPLIEAALAPVK